MNVLKKNIKRISRLHFSSASRTKFINPERFCEESDLNTPKGAGGLFGQDSRCPYCKGWGIARCSNCDGIGTIYYYSFKRYSCRNCGGTGIATCVMCSGSGYSPLL